MGRQTLFKPTIEQSNKFNNNKKATWKNAKHSNKNIKLTIFHAHGTACPSDEGSDAKIKLHNPKLDPRFDCNFIKVINFNVRNRYGSTFAGKVKVPLMKSYKTLNINKIHKSNLVEIMSLSFGDSKSIKSFCRTITFCVMSSGELITLTNRETLKTNKLSCFCCSVNR